MRRKQISSTIHDSKFAGISHASVSKRKGADVCFDLSDSRPSGPSQVRQVCEVCQACQVCRPSSPRPARPCSVHVLVKRQTKSVSDFLQHIPTYKDDIQRISTGCAVWTTSSSTILSVGKSYFVFHYRLPWFQYILLQIEYLLMNFRVKMSLIF